MKTNQAVAVMGLAALSATQVGCFYDPCSFPAIGGKNKVLNLFVPQDAARGLQTEVELAPRVLAMFENPFALPTRDPNSCFDFDGAEIQVSLPEALQSPPATVDREIPDVISIGIRFTCGAQTEDAQEVTVRVVAGDTVRYEDAFDITCHAVARASAEPVAVSRPLQGNAFVVGGLLHAQLTLVAADSGPLRGVGAVPVDDMLVAVPHVSFSDPETFRVAKPGQSPMLRIGSFLSELPVVLVPDDAWTFQQDTPRPGETQGVFQFSAWPKTAGGARLNGVEECQWTAFTATDSEVLADTLCDIVHSTTLPGVNRFITRMCAEALGREACVDMPQ
ncbi:MAG TPA: hypothetical protein VND93_02445 [Myxococcales bacterium]|nr:hypothetical protein [Myxococcales bacterium]